MHDVALRTRIPHDDDKNFRRQQEYVMALNNILSISCKKAHPLSVQSRKEAKSNRCKIELSNPGYTKVR
jgi:hypothetical protein